VKATGLYDDSNKSVGTMMRGAATADP